MKKLVYRFKRSMLYLKIILPFSCWAIKKAEQARDNLKMLGWFWGTICALVSAIIFYAPAIYWAIMYFITDNAWYWAKAGGYVLWWFAPIFSPGIVTYLLIVLFITTVAIKIKKILLNKEAKSL